MKYLGPPQSASWAGITASRNRFGQYYRARSGRGGIPLVPLTGAAAWWDALTDVQRLSWSSWAAALVRRDRLGQAYPLTGRAAGVGQWIRSQWIGLPPLSDPPAGWDRGAVTSIGLIDLGGGVVDVTVVVEGNVWMQAATTSFTHAENAGVSRPPGKGHWWRLYVLQGPGPGTFTGPTPAIAHTAGQKTWVRAQTVHALTRLASPWVLAGPVALS